MLSRSRFFLLSFLLLAWLPLAGCQYLNSALGALFEKPKMNFKKLHLRDFSFAGVTTDFEFELNNPNNVSLSLESIAFQLDIEGTTLFKGETTRPIEMRAKGISPVMLPFSVEFMKVVKVITALVPFFQGKQDAAWALNVRFGVKTPIGILSFPFDLKGVIPVPRLPKVMFQGAKLNNVSLMGASVSFQVLLKNEADFPVNFRGLSYNLSLSNTPFANGTSQAQQLGPGGTQLLDIPVNINFLQAGMAIASVIQSKRLPYSFQGSLDLGLFKLPIVLQGEANL